MTKLITKEEVVINEVKRIIEESKKKVASYVNTTLLFTYWNIGKLIVEYQGGLERAKYGDKLIERLSIELTTFFLDSSIILFISLITTSSLVINLVIFSITFSISKKSS